MQIHHWALLDAGTLGLIGVIGADHALGRLDHLAALDEANQPLL